MSHPPQTPPGRQPISQDSLTTPHNRAKSTSQPQFSNNPHLKSKREIMMEEVGVWVVPLEHMEKLFVLPGWLDRHMTRLRTNSEFLKGSVWDALDACFDPNGEALKDLTEKSIYDHLEELHDHVKSTCERWGIGTVHVPARTYVSRERYTPPSENKINTSKPDATTLVRYEGEDKDVSDFYRWRYIIAVFEFKIKNFRTLFYEMGLENAQQEMWNMQHMLWDNLDRRFSVGMTVEGIEARLWIACRSAVFVSKPFEVNKDRRSLFRALAFFAYGEDVALGRDPTIIRLGDEPYKVVIANKRYLLVDILADYRARALIGSGCRVYDALLVNEDARQPESTDDDNKKGKTMKRVVIKDIWRDEHRESEFAIYDRVMKAIETQEAKGSGQTSLPSPGAAARPAREYFVKMSASEDVTLEGGHLDDTRAILGYQGTLEEGWEYLDAKLNQPEVVDDRYGAHMPSAGGLVRLTAGQTEANPTSNEPAIHARIHHRTVMVDVGVPLHEVERLDIAFSALADVTHACKLMCQAGYNHRDLSCGNIIVDEDNVQGRLGDLEFAKLHGSNSGGHNMRTGTPDFMALEILVQRYSFAQEGADAPAADLPVRHNAGHDLESILWIAAFMLYNSLVFDAGEKSPSEEDLKQLGDARAMERAQIFDYQKRSTVFGPPGLANLIKKHTTNRAAIMAYKFIDKIELALKSKYREFEAKLSDADQGETRNLEFLPLHGVFEDTLREISGLFKDKTFVYIGRKHDGQEGGDTSQPPKRQKLSAARQKLAMRGA